MHVWWSIVTNNVQFAVVLEQYTVYREIFAALSFREIKIREKYFRESYTCAIKGVAWRLFRD